MPNYINIMTYRPKNKPVKYLVPFLFLLILGLLPAGVQAQNVSFGADFVNRYVWRGFDFGNSVSVQPHVDFSVGKLSLSDWADYALGPVTSSDPGYSENDLSASYNFGPVSVGVTDYYFPSAGADFFNYKNGGNGAHTLEPNISLGGVKSFPVVLFAAFNAYNDPDHSVYLQASLPFRVHKTKVALTIGGIPTSGAGNNGVDDYYGNRKAAITNLKFSVSRTFKITDDFSLPVFGSYIINPYTNQVHTVFGISL